MNDLMSLLFETNAFQICKENEPFWLTSGTISPYYNNTHFLYGSPESAQELLDFIDIQLETVSKDSIPANLFEKVFTQYQKNAIYKTVIDSLKEFIEANTDLTSIDYISGGERRDWFFSILMAYFLKKPHITIYKDLSTVVSTYDFKESKTIEKLDNKRILHITDLINIVSSYVRAWIPAIESLGSKIITSIAVVDRMQGGSQTLKEHNIESFTLLQVDNILFKKAKELGIINENQLDMLNKYTENPDECMREFLIEHPEFLENALHSDNPKTVKRAKTCVEQNLYHL